MPSTCDIKSMMDKQYAEGTAYQTSLPFDLKRGESIRLATLRLSSHAGCNASIKTLDVGSGQGGIAAFWPHTNITGVEISEVAVEQARKAHPNVRYICSSIESYRLDPGETPYGLVVAQESIEHWTETTLGLKNIYESLDIPGHGYLIITTPNRDSLHCRMARKLGFEAPYCSFDHIHEFGYRELIDHVESIGFERVHSLGVGLLPYWTLPLPPEIRRLTDSDTEVVEWFERMGASVPVEFSFIQCHLFRKLRRR